MINKTLSIAFYLLFLIGPSLFAQNATEIVRKSDKLLRGSSSKAELSITIIRPKWERTMSMRAWSKGDDYAMIVIDQPVKEKGTVFLKRKKELWNWLPRISRTIKLPASMMSQSWMGTDMSNDELVKQSSIINDFEHSYLRSETINGKECHVIQLLPKEEATVVWGKLIMWIDKTGYMQMKVEQYDEDEYLVNTATAIETKLFGKKELPSKIEVIPADDPGQKTIMVYKNLEFDIPLSDDFFSIQNMKKIR